MASSQKGKKETRSNIQADNNKVSSANSSESNSSRQVKPGGLINVNSNNTYQEYEFELNKKKELI